MGVETVALGVLAFILGALGRRIAGGVLNQWASPSTNGAGTTVMGDTPARLIYSVNVSLAVILSAVVVHHMSIPNSLAALAMVLAVFVGTTTGNDNSLSMGTAGYTFKHDFLGMLVHGIESAILPGAVIGLATRFCLGEGLSQVFTIAAIAATTIAVGCPVVYYVGWRIAGLKGASYMPLGLKGGTEIGEALWGGLTALTVFTAMVCGQA